LLGSFVVSSALHSCRLKVDLPDDFGPIVIAQMEPFFSSALPVSWVKTFCVAESVSKTFKERCKGSSWLVSRKAKDRPFASDVQMLRNKGDSFAMRFKVDLAEVTRITVGLLRAVMGGKACTVGAYTL